MAELHHWQSVGTTESDGYEWFYFDAELPGQAAIFISIMGPNPFDFSPFGRRADDGPPVQCPDCQRTPLPHHHYGVAVGGVSQGMPFEAEDYAHVASPAREVSFTDAPWRLTFPGATVERDDAAGLPVYRVTVNVKDVARDCRVTGTLEFVATQGEWTVPDALLFEDVNDRAHRHHWAVHVPHARVTGQLTVTLQGTEHPVLVDQWLGYHDHNWGTRRVSQGFARWIWGRALLPDGRTVIAASIIPNLGRGETAQRMPEVSVVLSPAGVESELITLVEPAGANSAVPIRTRPNGIEVPGVLSYGVSQAGAGHHTRFDTAQVLPGEFPGVYQRRIALVTLTGANGSVANGLGVNETLVAANFP